MGKRKGDSYGEEKEKIPKLEERPLAEFSKICQKISDDKLDVEILRKFLDELEDNKDNDSTLSLIRSSFDDKLIISLLSTYSLTRSEQDELIFTILQKAERVYQVELSKYFPIIWGQNAKKNYENLQKFGTSLHVRITPNEVSCELFAKTNCLAFVFTCCSSPHSTTRVLAYYCLQRYLGLITTLQAEIFEERTFLIYVLKLFRQSVEIEAQRLSNIITHFFARTVDLLFHAGENPITNAIIAFLCLKPVVDFNNVPEFYKLLFSSSTEHHKEEQNWILMLISEALIEPMDYNLLQNRNGLKLLQGVFASSMTDQTSRKHILSILKSCVQMPTLANELFTKINLPTWICTAIKTRSLTFWEQNYLAQIYNELLVSQRKWMKANKKAEDRTFASFVAKMTAKGICSQLNHIAEKGAEKFPIESSKAQTMTNEIEKELKRKVWAKFETKEKETDEIVED